MGVLRWIVNNLLLVLTVGGVFVGTAIGFVLRPYNLSEETIMLLSFPGDVLMRMLKMIILPLIISSLIAGTMDIDKPQVAGWTTKENFLIFLQHFGKHSNSSTEHPVLLLLNNHESHILFLALFVAVCAKVFVTVERYTILFFVC